MKPPLFKIGCHLVAAMCAALTSFASPGSIQVVEGDFTTGEFTLRLPAFEGTLRLYSATAKLDDPLLDDLSQWCDPHFIQDVTAGTTELNVTIPPIPTTDAVCFFLADPERATVRRVSYLIGGKDGNGKFNSAFLTGLHPNYDWRYEIAFAVPEFGTGQSWLLCHRDSANNKNSLLLLAVRGANSQANDKKLRFGYGAGDNDIQTPNQISENVIYQASIDGRTCVYSNLTDGIVFETVQATASTAAYVQYNLCFGASVNGTSFNSGDGCSFAQVYSFKAWNGDGELVADYRPIVQGTDAGFFDVVTRTLFKSGAGFTATFTPYVASDDELLIDTLTAHLGEPVAVSEILAQARIFCESESLPFAKDALPAYGEKSAQVGESVTFVVPTDEFIWKDESTKETYRVRSAGLRIDVYDPVTGTFIKGVPQPNLTSYTFTRESADDGVRVVCLWNAEKLEAAGGGRQADCLRLVSVGTRADGKTEVTHGPFDTGVHPVPATTRVLMDVGFDNTTARTQKAQCPDECNERRFFGVRDKGSDGQRPDTYQRNFQLCRTLEGAGYQMRVDMCDTIDDAPNSGNYAFSLDTISRYQIDLNPRFVRFDRLDKSERHLAELRGNYERSTEPLEGTLHIFGQLRGVGDGSPQLCVDYNDTRYYSFAIWQDGETLTRDYVPCLDAANRPAFYDRVAKNYIYPIGDKAVYEAEFGADKGLGSVQVMGENAAGEAATYLDPDATPPGFYAVPTGESYTFTATERTVFRLCVVGHRIDTWTDAGWVKGTVQSGRTVTLDGEDSIRRLVWIWKNPNGLTIILR